MNGFYNKDAISQHDYPKAVWAKYETRRIK